MCFSYRLQLLLFFLGMSFLSGNAQKRISTTQLLLGANQIEQVKFDSIQLAFLKNYNHNLQLIDNIEFRTETRDLLLPRQEYAIRVKPNSLRGRLANKKVYRSKINEVQIQGRIRLIEELEDRYYLLVAYVFNKKLIDAYQFRKTQLKDKISLLKTAIYSEVFNVNDLIDTEEALFDNQIILQNLQQAQAYHDAILQLMIGNRKNNNYLKSDDIITPKNCLLLRKRFVLKTSPLNTKTNMF